MIEVGGAKCTVDQTWPTAFTVECIVKMFSKNERFPARGLKRIQDMDMVEGHGFVVLVEAKGGGGATLKKSKKSKSISGIFCKTLQWQSEYSIDGSLYCDGKLNHVQ